MRHHISVCLLLAVALLGLVDGFSQLSHSLAHHHNVRLKPQQDHTIKMTKEDNIDETSSTILRQQADQLRAKAQALREQVGESTSTTAPSLSLIHI